MHDWKTFHCVRFKLKQTASAGNFNWSRLWTFFCRKMRCRLAVKCKTHETVKETTSQSDTWELCCLDLKFFQLLGPKGSFRLVATNAPSLPSIVLKMRSDFEVQFASSYSAPYQHLHAFTPRLVDFFKNQHVLAMRNASTFNFSYFLFITSVLLISL